MTNSTWGEKAFPGVRNPRLASEKYLVKFWIMHIHDYPLTITGSTFDCNNTLDTNTIYSHEMKELGDKSVFKFELE